jgi:hypothetical protein
MKVLLRLLVRGRRRYLDSSRQKKRRGRDLVRNYTIAITDVQPKTLGGNDDKSP